MFSNARVRPATQELKKAVEVLSSGLPDLDRLLPHGGFPCGRLSEISGRRCSGKRSLALSLCGQTLAQGKPVVWIDAAGGFYPLPSLEAGAPFGRLVVVRPPVRRNAAKKSRRAARRNKTSPALEAAAILLQGGSAVSLVVVDLPTGHWIAERQLGRIRLDAATSGAAVVFVTESDPGGDSLGTFVCLHLGVRRTRIDRLLVEVTKSKLGNMGFRTPITVAEPHSVHVESTL